MMLHFSGHMMIEMGSEANTLPLHRMRVLATYYPGLVILFVISGFFGACSMDRSSSIKGFLKKKFFRIYPELWVCMMVMLITAVLALGVSIIKPSLLVWILVQGLGISFTPGVIESFGTGSFNGTLWTVFIQVQFYIIIAFGWKIIREKFTKKLWLLVIFPIAIVMNIMSGFLSGRSAMLDLAIERSIVPYLLWFFIGVFGYCYRDEIVDALRKMFLPMVVIYAISMFIYLRVPESWFSKLWECGYYSGALRSIICGLTFLALGVGGIRVLPSVRAKINISYELFLYHWIVLNMILHFNLYEKWGWVWCFILFVVGTTALCFVSKFALKILHLEKRTNVKENA